MEWQPYPRWVTSETGQRVLVLNEAQEKQVAGEKKPAEKPKK